ncbi:MAG: zinc ribbon domain-containing protein [Candidatus Freyarchaeota archaeon]|nr:zinc ribbon domain-containing protein [Candidatus Jordarchaeia archaeon]MBS7280565.1 zinc ribbon domain-containing protein [Candidatus Jordarchaeia archaeon]
MSNSRDVWFRGREGRRRLEIEFSAMSILFPEAQLRIKDEQIFWYWKYQEHEVIIRYPPDYPQSPLEIVTSPQVEALPYEEPCYFAPTAAFLAQLRIRREDTQKLSQLEAADDLVSAHWYSNDWGRQRLQKDVAEVRALVPDLRLLRLRDGAIAYQLKAGEVNTLIICPPNYPQEHPNVIVTLNSEELEIPLQSIEDWSVDASIRNLVEEILQVSEQAKRNASNYRKKYLILIFKVCPYCGRRNSGDANFCISCGSNIAPPPKTENQIEQKK